MNEAKSSVSFATEVSDLKSLPNHDATRWQDIHPISMHTDITSEGEDT